eukprot:m.220444 g.220444  ORF g.220444 m.220444 type:complete len:422 (-) comp15601_c0_seq2:145-1410(-)
MAISKSVADVIAQVARRDPRCTCIQLRFGGKSSWLGWFVDTSDESEVAKSLAQALAGNTWVTVLKLSFSSECQKKRIKDLLGPAIMTNTSITSLSITGLGKIPDNWQARIQFNDRLAILLLTAQPAPINNANEPGAEVDLRDMPWAVPKTIFGHLMGRFRVGKKLANGGFGVVFLGSFKGDTVAVKTHVAFQYPESYNLADPETKSSVIQECMREILALRRLESHKNVIGFKGVVYTTDQGHVLPTYICMELAKTTLQDLIKAKKARLLPDMLGIACGLDFIHSQGMMHRDLKPANILVDENGEVKIGDLGLVKMAHILNRNGKHSLVGTPLYLAPEVSNNFRNYGPAVDVYALGIIAWEIQLRRDPAEDHPSRLQQIARFGHAMGEFAWLPQRCAATDPKQRPSSRGLYLALEHFSQHCN